MDFSDSQEIAAPREKVFAALNNESILQQCIPGCESLTATADHRFDAVVGLKVGPVKAKFAGRVTISDLKPPASYTLSGEAKAVAAGFAKGSATVTLEEQGAGTLLTYKVSASAGGKIAQLGARLMEATARRLAGEFFEKFQALVEEEQPRPEPVEASDVPVVDEPPGQGADAVVTPKSGRGRVSTLRLLLAVLVILGVLYYYFG